jgi:hypothetical protein
MIILQNPIDRLDGYTISKNKVEFTRNMLVVIITTCQYIHFNIQYSRREWTQKNEKKIALHYKKWLLTCKTFGIIFI